MPFLTDGSAAQGEKAGRVVDLDIDIGADAVDYKYIYFLIFLQDRMSLTEHLSQRHCQPRIFVRSRDGNAET